MIVFDFSQKEPPTNYFAYTNKWTHFHHPSRFSVLAFTHTRCNQWPCGAITVTTPRRHSFPFHAHWLLIFMYKSFVFFFLRYFLGTFSRCVHAFGEMWESEGKKERENEFVPSTAASQTPNEWIVVVVVFHEQYSFIHLALWFYDKCSIVRFFLFQSSFCFFSSLSFSSTPEYAYRFLINILLHNGECVSFYLDFVKEQTPERRVHFHSKVVGLGCSVWIFGCQFWSSFLLQRLRIS